MISFQSAMNPSFLFEPASISLDFVRIVAETRVTDLAPQYEAQQATGNGLAICVSAGLIFALTGMVIAWIVRRRRQDSPISDELTIELCRVHNIRLAHRIALDRVATAAECEFTAELFLSPHHFDQAVERAGAKRRLKRSQRSAIGQVRRVLFGVHPCVCIAHASPDDSRPRGAGFQPAETIKIAPDKKCRQAKKV